MASLTASILPRWQPVSKQILRPATAHCFSTTRQRQAVPVTFTRVQDGELNEIFQKIEEHYIFPSLLPEKQRKIVFDPKKASYMSSNPVQLEIDGQEHRFAPMNLQKLENSRALLVRAIHRMKTKEDWDQLPVLLAGYRRAGIVIRPSRMAMIVRFAGIRGQIYKIIESATQAQETGLTLGGNKELFVRLLEFINEKILESGRNLRETKQAAKWLELVLDLEARQRQGALNMQHLRIVRGMTLFTRASLLKAKQDAGEAVTEEELERLRQELETLSTLWKSNVSDESTTSHMKQLGFRDKYDGMGDTTAVWVLSNNIFALRLAREVLGEGAMGTLDPVQEHLEKFLLSWISSSNPRMKPKASEVYERLFGKAA